MFDTYDRIFAARAGSYHAAMVSFPSARRLEFGAAIARAGDLDGALLCDVPAGGGYLRSFLDPARTRYLALEPARPFATNCPRGDGTRAVQADMAALPLRDGVADAVISLAGLHHAPDLSAIFRELRRIAGPHARVVVADAEEGTPTARFLNGFVHEKSGMGHEGRFLGVSTVARLEEAGLVVLGDELRTVPWGFDEVEGMGAFARALFGVDLADATETARALEDIVGLVEGDHPVNLAWQLRYLTCVPA